VGSAPTRAAQSSRNALVQQDHSSVDEAEFDFSSGVIERMEAGMEGESQAYSAPLPSRQRSGGTRI
jgi:hypothetical protein